MKQGMRYIDMIRKSLNEDKPEDDPNTYELDSDDSLPCEPPWAYRITPILPSPDDDFKLGYNPSEHARLVKPLLEMAKTHKIQRDHLGVPIQDGDGKYTVTTPVGTQFKTRHPPMVFDFGEYDEHGDLIRFVTDRPYNRIPIIFGQACCLYNRDLAFRRTCRHEEDKTFATLMLEPHETLIKASTSNAANELDETRVTTMSELAPDGSRIMYWTLENGDKIPLFFGHARYQFSLRLRKNKEDIESARRN